jgi:hypothetical protein
MATESIGRTDDGIAWAVYHVLWGGPWWWEMTLPDGRRVESPERYKNERQALDAVEDARRQVLAGRPPVETMSSLRTRAEAAEADLDALARTVGGAIVAGALAPGESLTSPPQHAIVSTVNRLRARAEAAEARAIDAEAQAAIARGALLLAEADARLMLAELYYADECGIFDDRLLLDVRAAVSDMARARTSTPRSAWVDAVRRILASAGGT